MGGGGGRLSSALVRVGLTGVLAETHPGDQLASAAVALASAATAASTARTYAAAWRLFQDFCEREKVPSLPATRLTVGRWLAERSGAGSGGSVRRDIAAVRDRHIALGLPDPTHDAWVQRVAAGSQRLAAATRVSRSERQALPTAVVGALLERVPSWLGIGSHHSASTGATETGVLALRDAALTALGLRLMRRGAEIAALRVSDVEDQPTGVTVCIRRSKTDQAGAGLRLPMEASDSSTCPVRLLRRWLAVRDRLAVRGAPCDALFLSARGSALTTSAISAIVRRAAASVGLSGSFSAHSLRIGGATAAMGAGASLATIQAVGGWSSDAVQRYLRPAAAAQAGFSSAIGL